MITAASLLFCLAPAWPHEPDRMDRGWMERGWIYFVQVEGDNEYYDFVLVDPARIENETIYWDAISHICQFGVECLVIFFLDSDLIPYDLGFTVHDVPDVFNFRDELKNASAAFFYYDAGPGKSALVFACDTIRKKACY